MAVNPNTTTILGSYNAMVPAEGPKVVPVIAQLQANQAVTIDLSQLQQQGKISFIQGLMVDNSLNAQPVTVTSQAFNQKILVPAGAQAVLPIFVINPPVFIAASTGGVNVPLFFFNIPLPAQVWNQGSAGFTFTGGSLNVIDTALSALISNLGGGNALAVNVVTSVPADTAAPFTNAAAGTSANFTLKGGVYAFEFSATGGPGTVIMNVLGPDGATFINIGLTAITTSPNFQTIALPAGTYQVVITTFTANYVKITRVGGA